MAESESSKWCPTCSPGEIQGSGVYCERHEPGGRVLAIETVAAVIRAAHGAKADPIKSHQQAVEVVDALDRIYQPAAAEPAPVLCECGHPAAMHVDRVGSCTTGAAEHCFGFEPAFAPGWHPVDGIRYRHKRRTDIPKCRVANCGPWPCEPIRLADAFDTLWPALEHVTEWWKSEQALRRDVDAQRDDARARLEEIRALHAPQPLMGGDDICAACSWPPNSVTWPCPTALILGRPVGA